MADSQVQAAFTPFTPTNYYDPETGAFNSGAFTQKIGELAEQTRQVSEPKMPDLSGYKYNEDPRIKAAMASYEASREPLQRQAQRAATALEIQGQNTAQQMKALEEIEEDITARQATASGMWQDAIEQADEYVQSAYNRTADVLNKLETMARDIGFGLQFDKAAAMEASVDAVLGSLDDSSRETARMYGVESDEYRMVQEKKRQSLGAIQSSINTAYGKIKAEQDINIMNATNQAMQQMNMYVNFAEQQHVETWMAAAKDSAAYDMQSAQMRVSIEQLRASGMENMANWLIATPSFSMDIQPFVALVSEINAEQEAIRAAKAQERLAQTEFTSKTKSLPPPPSNAWSSYSMKAAEQEAYKAKYRLGYYS